MSNTNKEFWEQYYKNNTNIDKIKSNSSFSTYVYDNYISKYNKENVFLKIADLGCGNCRDSIYFSQKCNICYAVDSSGVIDGEYKNCNLVIDDVEELLKCNKLQTLVDIVYMRWFLHAMTYDKSKNIFNYAVKNLKSNGLVCIEVRSYNDEELKKNGIYDETDKSFTTTHKRWLYTMDMCKDLATENECEVLYCEEGYFSPSINTETDNPLLIRFICRKKLLPYYEKSKNYDIYKHILPKMKDNAIISYSNMDIMNKILEKHNIKYVAVAGTALGLNRHGGIIPWDNDIDLGFIDSEWQKLLAITDELESNGLKFTPRPEHNNRVIHFGVIDCIHLYDFVPDINSYCGIAGTFCSVDEYENTVKQIFGYSYIVAPVTSVKSLSQRYGINYFNTGNVNDNYHFRDESVSTFTLDPHDLSYQLKHKINDDDINKVINNDIDKINDDIINKINDDIINKITDDIIDKINDDIIDKIINGIVNKVTDNIVNKIISGVVNKVNNINTNKIVDSVINKIFDDFTNKITDTTKIIDNL